MFGWLKSSKKVVATPPELAQVLEAHLTGLRTDAVKGYTRLFEEAPSAVTGFLLTAVRIQLGNLAGVRQLLAELMGTADVVASIVEPLQSLCGSDPSRLITLLLEVGDDLRRYHVGEEATLYYRIAAELDPQAPEAWYRLGDCLHDLRLYEEARKSLEAALTVDPDHWAACYTYAVLLQDVGCDAEAVEYYLHALELREDHAKCHNNLGSALLNTGHAPEALPHFQRAVELDPQFGQAFANLGTVLNQQGRFHEALSALNKAMNLGAPVGNWVKHALILPAVVAGSDEIEQARHRMRQQLQMLSEQGATLSDPLREVGITPSYLAYHGLDDLPLLRQLADFYLAACPQLEFVAPHCVSQLPLRPQGTRIRIGFLSTFMYDNSIGRNVSQLISKLARDRFEVSAISTFPRRDPVAEAIVEQADACIQIPMNLSAAQQMIAEARLDLLVYCDVGLEPLSYVLAFARLAPVQIAGSGHPSTTGIPTVDYFLSHQECEPADWDDHYNEKLLQLGPQVSYTYQERPRPAAQPKSRAELSLDPEAHLYLCPQPACQVHPDMDRLFAEILQSDPKGQLLFLANEHASWNEQLGRRLAASLPDSAGRVRFLPGMAQTDYLDTLRRADVILDTLHYNGGAPVLDGLALGTPVVTLPGAFMRGRQTYACYRRLGIAECVAKSPEEYVQKAVQIAGNPELRGELSRRILAAAPLFFEDAGIVQEFERLVLEVVT